MGRLDDEAVVALFDEQAPPLVRAVRLLVDDQGEAEEIVQEAFTRLLTSRRRLRDLDRAPAYLRSVAFNLARTALRRRQSARMKAPLLIDRADSPAAETTAMLRADTAAIADALARLSDRQRECLVLRYYLALSEAEVAEALGISKGSVKTHTSRGIDAMGDLLRTSR